MTRSRRQRDLALFMAVSTALFLVPVPGWSADDAQFGGRVFESDGITPYEGVVIALYDAGNEQVYWSDSTGTEGTFLIDEAPAGTYAVVAETGEGAFLTAETLEIQAGDNRPLSLTLKVAPGQSQSGSQLEPWKKWTIAGGIGVAALVLVLDVTDSAGERIASPDEIELPR